MTNDIEKTLNWRDIKSDPPPNGHKVYSRRSGEAGYHPGTHYHAKSRKLYTIKKYRNRTDITVWHNDKWAYHPSIEKQMIAAERLVKLKKASGSLSWEIANHQAYGKHFPEKWNDDLLEIKTEIKQIEDYMRELNDQ